MPVASKPKKVVGGVKGDRQVKYPNRKKSEPYSLITVELAKEIMGWVEETEDKKFGTDYLLEIGGKKIRCTNNITNRPLYLGNVETLKRDILNNHWKYNAEVIIIGTTGLVLNGQHSLLALIWAEWERTEGPDKIHWQEVWDGPCVLDKDITYGVNEDDATVNTMDTCKPRSLTDVLYRSAFFKDMSEGDRKAVARACSFAVQLLWTRTGGSFGGFVGKDKGKHTHAEYVDFLQRHSKLMECVRHIYQENKGGSIQKHITVGYASAIMYLMAASDTDNEEYHFAEVKNETFINFDKWDKARAFWVALASGAAEFADVRYVLGGLVDPTTGTPNDVPSVIAVLANAWDQYKDGYQPDKDYIQLKLSEPDQHTGIRVVTEWPNFGGIDKGQEVLVKKGDQASDDDDAESPDGTTQEEDGEKVKVNRGPDAESLKKQFADLCAEHPDYILLIRNPEAWVTWEEHAEIVSEVADLNLIEKGGLKTTNFKPEQFGTIASKLVEAGHKVAQCYPDGKKMTVTPFELEQPTKPKPKGKAVAPKSTAETPTKTEAKPKPKSAKK